MLGRENLLGTAAWKAPLRAQNTIDWSSGGCSDMKSEVENKTNKKGALVGLVWVFYTRGVYTLSHNRCFKRKTACFELLGRFLLHPLPARVCALIKEQRAKKALNRWETTLRCAILECCVSKKL